MELSKEEFDQWRSGNPVTVEMHRIWENQRQELLEELGQGRTINMDSADNTLMLTVLKVGQIQGMNQLLNTVFIEDKKEKA